MRIDYAFRLSSYLTLGLACLCLGYAELLFLPGIAVLVLPILVVLVAAFIAEDRWYLPVWAANVLGLAIATGSALWIAACLLWPGTSRLEGIPMPASLLPALGPLLTVLLLAKLFRPRRPSDLWLVQGMGLLQVGLGCVLANDLFFGALLLAYLTSGLWFLALFYLQRELVGPMPAAPQPEPAVLDRRVPWRSLGLYQAGRWTAVVTLTAVILFLAIPRFGGSQWTLGPLTGTPAPERWAASIGYSGMIDLKRTGKLRVSDEAALLVRAEDSTGEPLSTLGARQRWRGIVLDRYFDGRWSSRHSYMGRGERGAGQPGPPRWRSIERPPLTGLLPALGPRQFFVTFHYDPLSVGGLVLAEPVVVFPGQQGPPVACLNGDDFPDLQFHERDWVLVLTQDRARALDDICYRQVIVPLEEPDLSPPVRVEPMYLDRLREQPSPSLKEWTDRLLRDLAARSCYQLSPDDLQYRYDGSEQAWVLRPECQEKAARALTAYLATSGDYTYTLDLRRHDLELDPTEDFLINIRQGHCERYAGALALMLRSQGIAARVVTGFCGADYRGNGHYLIRHRDAHSWVETLIPRPQPDGNPETHWLTLDPTPELQAPEVSRFSLAWWWENGDRLGRAAWRDFVVEYDLNNQSALWGEWGGQVAEGSWQVISFWAARPWPWLVALTAVLAGWWLARHRPWRRWRGSRAPAPTVPFYDRLLAILDRRCQLRPLPSQTAREFAEAARDRLSGHAAAAGLAELPGRVADLFYRVRYGRRPLRDEEQQELERQLAQLDAALVS